MQRLKKIPFFLILLVMFFCLHGSLENYGFLEAKEVLWVGLLVSSVMLILFFITLFFTRDRLMAGLIIFFISLWYIFFGAIHDWIGNQSLLAFMHRYAVLLPLLLVVTIAWVIYLKRNKQRHQRWAFYLNVLLIIYCSIDGFLLLRNYFLPVKHTLATISFDKTKVKNKPNVYYLLFDEYPGYTTLRDSFAFNNDSLYHNLKQHDFEILPTFSNYDFTLFSMSSIFNMQYVDSNYDHGHLTQRDMQVRLNEIKNNQAMSIFNSMGYTIENYSIFDIAGHQNIAARHSLFPMHTPLLTDKFFHNRLMKDLSWWLITGKFKIASLKEKYFYSKDKDNQYMAQMLIESAARKSDEPKFCYAHFLMPHRPFFRDSSGQLRNFTSSREMYDLYFDKPVYLSYLKYTNRVITTLIEKITKNDSSAIVVVMSDHGFHTFNNAISYNPLNYDNICAVRFPDKNYIAVKEKWSTVNFFRYLFNCEFGQQLPFLKDSTIWINL